MPISPRFRAAVEDTDAYASVLLVILLDLFGLEALEWTPETMAMELFDELGARLPPENLAKLSVASALVTTDRFYHDLPFFVTVCNVLSGDIPDPRVYDNADAEECAWGLAEGLLLSPPEPDQDEPFAEEILRYLGETLKWEGITTPPDILKIAIVDQADPLADFADDPTMYGAMADVQTSKSADIEQSLRGNLTELVAQLESLPLRNGDAAQLVQKMRKGLATGVQGSGNAA
jgi:hypothetical protein